MKTLNAGTQLVLFAFSRQMRTAFKYVIYVNNFIYFFVFRNFNVNTNAMFKINVLSFVFLLKVLSQRINLRK